MPSSKRRRTKAIVTLPDCMIIEIFSRLPVKSLCRFKCVSKFFLSFIQESSFIDGLRSKTPILLQVQPEQDRRLCAYSIDSNGVSTLKHNYEYKNALTHLPNFHLCYCNGLNCYFCNDSLGLRVCNIATKEEIPLPRWCHDCILCFDSSSQKYKILGWQEKFDCTPIDFQVLTLERNPSWRPIVNPLKMEFILESEAIVNGEPFWLDIYGAEKRIVSFNPAREEFREIGLPVQPRVYVFWYCILEFEGSLCLLEQCHRQGPFNLWILNGDVWVTMKKNITLPFEDTNLHGRYSSPSQMELWPVEGFNFSSQGGEMLVAEMADYDYKFLFIYSFLNYKFKKINITGLPFSTFMMRNYVEKCGSLQVVVRNH